MPIKIPNGITRQQHTSGGCSCLFYKITSKTGLKLFKTKKLALCSYLIHDTLSHHPATKDLVPKIRGKLIKVDGKFGYAVEIVKVEDDIGESGYDEMHDFISSGSGEDVRDKLVSVAKFELIDVKQFTSLFNFNDSVYNYIENIFEDNHCGNWGIKKGKYVWIDFSQNYFN